MSEVNATPPDERKKKSEIMKRFFRKYRKWFYVAGVIVGLCFVYSLFFPLPLRHRFQYRSVVSIRLRYCFAATAGGSDTVFFSGYTAADGLTHLGSTQAKAATTNRGTGFWFSPLPFAINNMGRMVTAAAVASPDTLIGRIESRIDSILNRELTRLEEQQHDIDEGRRQFEYYMNTHDVMDEGYNEVAYFRDRVEENFNETRTLVSRLQNMLRSDSVHVTFLSEYSYSTVDRDGRVKGRFAPCRRIKTEDEGNRGTVVLQTMNRLRPIDTDVVSYPLLNLMRFTSKEHPRRAIAYAFNYTVMPDSAAGTKVSRFEGRVWKTGTDGAYETDIPALPCADGAPVVDRRGVLIGLLGQGHVIPVKR